jgi:hypothetical protein
MDAASHLLVALMAGLVALMFGAIAGFYIGRPPRVEAPGGLVGQVTQSLGIKL